MFGIFKKDIGDFVSLVIYMNLFAFKFSMVLLAKKIEAFYKKYET